MRRKQKHPTFIALVFSLLFLIGCTRSSSTPPPKELEEKVVIQTVEVTRMIELPTPTPGSPTEEVLPTNEPASIFADVNLNYYAYDWIVWAYQNGYIEPCEVEGADPEAIHICADSQMQNGDLYVSADKYFHQDAEFAPIASTNLTFQDRGIEGHQYASAAEDLGRYLVLPKHFLCNWPSVQFSCPFVGSTRADGAVMIQTLAHTNQLVYDPLNYKGSWLVWPAFERSFPDVAYSFGLKEDEVKAPEALERDGIYQQRSASSDFGPKEPLTKAVWAEWLYSTFLLFGPPKPVPTSPIPSSP